MTESTYHHVGILVPDIEAAIAWFSEVLGVTFHAPHRMITHGRIDPAEFGDEEQHEGTSYLAWAKQGPPYYELVEAKGNGLHSIERHGPGLHHVGFFVPDVDAALARLTPAGVGVEGRVVAPDGTTMVCWTGSSYGPVRARLPRIPRIRTRTLTASSTLFTSRTDVTGPKISSCATRMFGFTSTSTVGSWKKPLPSAPSVATCPPAATVAPSFSAIGMNEWTRSSCEADTTGPTSVDASSPFPRRSFLALPTSLSTRSFATVLWAMTRDAAVQR